MHTRIGHRQVVVEMPLGQSIWVSVGNADSSTTLVALTPDEARFTAASLERAADVADQYAAQQAELEALDDMTGWFDS